MKSVVLVVIACLVSQVIIGTQSAEGAKVKIDYSVSLSAVGLKLDDSAIPAGVMLEAQNPQVKNPYTGNSFDKTTIGIFDPTDGVFPKMSASINVTASAATGNTPFFRLKCPFALDDTINGENSQGYAYSKQLGWGGDWVLYIYGAKVKYDLLAPELGYRWQKGQRSIDVGLELRTSHIKFFRGLEAFGRPQDLKLLGESDVKFYLLNTQYRFDNWSIGLTLPIKGGKGIGLVGGYQF